MEFRIYQKVERLGSSKDYTTGRIGEVVEIDGDRYKVRWFRTKNGELIQIKTWVNKKFLAEYHPPK